MNKATNLRNKCLYCFNDVCIIHFLYLTYIAGILIFLMGSMAAEKIQKKETNFQKILPVQHQDMN